MASGLRLATKDRKNAGGGPMRTSRPSSFSRRSLAHRVANAGHDLVRHELHRSFIEIRIDAVHSGVDEFPKVTDLISKFENLIDDAIYGTADDQLIEKFIESDLAVWLIRMALENHKALRAAHFAQHLVVIGAVWTLRIVSAIALRGGLVIGDKNGACNAPIGRIRRLADLLLALDVISPVCRNPFRQQKIC